MVVILLGTGFEEAEALVPADLMRRAGIEVALASISGEPEVAGSHGITVKADRALAELDPTAAELCMLPGGMGGVRSILACPAALDFVRAVHGGGGKVSAICAAPTILAGLGLLEGRRAVCYPGMEDQLTGALPQPDAPVVEDGPFITGEAAGSAFDFGLKLIEVLKGKEAADKVRHGVHYHG